MSTAVTSPAPRAAERLTGRPHGPAVAAALALGTCVTVNLVDPNVDGALGLCPFRVATGGLDCPGCGVLRATRALTRGDVLLALDHNLLWVLLVPALVWGLLGWWRAEVGARPHRPALPTVALPALAVLTATFWVLRTVPGVPLLSSGVG